jgi:hypothetical protein
MDDLEIVLKHYQDLVGLQLQVPCSSWDETEARRCWGEDFETKFARGVIQKIKVDRRSKEPRFEIKFPEKKFEKVFTGYSLEYVMSYSEDVPLKYHQEKAETIKKLAKAAEENAAKLPPENDFASKKMDGMIIIIKIIIIIYFPSLFVRICPFFRAEERKEAPATPSLKSATPNIKRPATQPCDSIRKKKEKVTPVSVIDSEEETDDEETAEFVDQDETVDVEDFTVPLYADEFATKDVEGPGIIHMDPDLWEFGKLPAKVNLNFEGKAGPNHTFNVASASPFDFFCLFIPIFFWERWAAYTNQKAEIELAKLKQKTKSPRGWTKTSAAELKCWVASVIWWCLGATQTFNSFWNEDYNQYRSYTQIDLRSRKFWHPLFWFILESALVNSWLLYKASCQLEKVELRYTFFSFKKSVALALASQWEKMGCRNFNPAESPSQKLRTTSHVKAHLFAKSKTDLFGTRFTEKDKHLSHRQKIPPLEGSTCTKRQLQCQECKKGRTTFWCTECQVPLCKDWCFQLFHTPK